MKQKTYESVKESSSTIDCDSIASSPRVGRTGAVAGTGATDSAAGAAEGNSNGFTSVGLTSST